MIKKLIAFLNAKRIDTLFFFKRCFGIKYTLFHFESGEAFKVRNIDKLGVSIYGDNFEVVLKNALLSKLRTGMTVLDIGANIGYYTVLMASRVGKNGRVIAFEPNPAIYNELNDNIALNGFNNVQTLHMALADTTGYSKFFFPSEGQEAHGSLARNCTFAESRIESVITDRLDEVLLRLNINKVDLIKMDVEGAELLVIRGAKNVLGGQSKPIILFECAENQCVSFGFKVFDVLSEIAAFGYVIEQVDYGNWVAIPKQEMAQ